MNIKNTLIVSGMLLSLNTAFAKDSDPLYQEEERLKPYPEAVEFGEYVESRPSESFLFETTTRMIDFEAKVMEITDVSSPKELMEYDQKTFVEVKKFDADFSGIAEVEGLFDYDSYPSKRIEDKCTLTVEEYALYIEGQFIDENTFKVMKLKPKLIDSMTNRYCKDGVSLTSEEPVVFTEIEDFNDQDIELKKTATFEIY